MSAKFIIVSMCLVVAVIFFLAVTDQQILSDGRDFYQHEHVHEPSNVRNIKNNHTPRPKKVMKERNHSGQLGNAISHETSCMDGTFMPRGSQPYVLLLSAPGSGNTWLRYLIESLTGVYTGSMYRDTRLLNGGFLGESEPPRSGRVIVVKTHSTDMHEKADGVLLLIRDPYSALTADFKRIAAGGNHTGIISSNIFNSEHWSMYARWAARRWQQTIQKGLEMSAAKRLVVYYEDLLEDLPEELRRVAHFLNATLREERLQCTMLHREGNFHRQPYSMPFDSFKENVVILAVDSAIRNARKTMERYGGPKMRSYERNLQMVSDKIMKLYVNDTINECTFCNRLVH
ncbi:sialate:O-sulfotransferase 1-like isoform X2 [Apostichopus japonicus]|uniref:sialate:O-sulfotransferase 1-like isoform X2 n=1 Tax=Stichopus japonicus TaxID=307972 RepID=UPI003AB23F3E